LYILPEPQGHGSFGFGIRLGLPIYKDKPVIRNQYAEPESARRAAIAQFQ
jgi:hypothetical protein